jgi:hypothetical protein
MVALTEEVWGANLSFFLNKPSFCPKGGMALRAEASNPITRRPHPLAI